MCSRSRAEAHRGSQLARSALIGSLRAPAPLVAILATAACTPLILRPSVAAGAAIGLIAGAIALRSVALTVGLAGAPALLIALIGENPFPDGAVAAFLAAWVVFALVTSYVSGRVRPGRPVGSAAVVASVALSAVLLVRLPASDAAGVGGRKLALFVASALVLLVAGLVIGRSAAEVDRLAMALLVVGAASAAALFLVSDRDAPSGGASDRLALSTEGDPISLGRTAAVALLAGGFLVLGSTSVGWRLFALGAMPLAVAGLLSTGSRGPILGLITGLIALGLCATRERSARVWVLILALGASAAAFLAWMLAPRANATRALDLFTGGDAGDVSNGRLDLWAQAWEAFGSHPWLGVGTGGFASLNPDALYPHDLVLELAVEAGLLGVILLVVAVGAGVRHLRCAFASSAGRHRIQVAFVVALFVSAASNALVSGSIADNGALWLAVGLAAGMHARTGAPVRPDPATHAQGYR